MLTRPSAAGKPRFLWYAPITVFFPLPPEHRWPVSVAVSERMTQGDTFLHKSSESGRGRWIVRRPRGTIEVSFKFSSDVSLYLQHSPLSLMLSLILHRLAKQEVAVSEMVSN